MSSLTPGDLGGWPLASLGGTHPKWRWLLPLWLSSSICSLGFLIFTSDNTTWTWSCVFHHWMYSFRLQLKHTTKYVYFNKRSAVSGCRSTRTVKAYSHCVTLTKLFLIFIVAVPPCEHPHRHQCKTITCVNRSRSRSPCRTVWMDVYEGCLFCNMCCKILKRQIRNAHSACNRFHEQLTSHAVAR